MQTNKTIQILLGILIVLVVAKAGQYVWQNRADDSDGYKKYWQGISAKDVTQLQLAKEGANLIISKQGDQAWKVNDTAADSATLNDWLPKLVSPTTVELVAESEAQYASLGISTASAQLAINTTKGDKTIILGSYSGNGLYVKLPQSSLVYLVSGLPATLASASMSDWIDKVIARIPESGISQLTFMEGKNSLIVKQTDGKWLVQDKEIDPAPLKPATQTLESFLTQGLLAEKDMAGLPNDPTVIVKVEQSGQNPVTLKLYQAKDTAAVMVEGNERLYQISNTLIQNFQIKPTDLKPKG